MSKSKIHKQTDRSHYFPYRRGEAYPPQMTIDFRKLNVDACRKYLRHHHIKVRPDCSANEFRVAVARHFDQTLEVDEVEIIRNFCKRISRTESDTAKPRQHRPTKRTSGRKPKLNQPTGNDDAPTSKKRRRVERGAKSARCMNPTLADSDEEPREGVEKDELYCVCQGRSYGKMIACENPDCEMKWFHFPCVNLTPATKPTGKWFCPDCTKRRSGKRIQNAKDVTEQGTYKNMIENALHKLAKKKRGKAEGTFKEICSMIEQHHWRNLNWKSESDIRKTPVWRSSVRKILFSNERFCRSQFNPNVFGFNSSSK